MTGRDEGEKRGAPIAPEELMPDGVITEEIKKQNESEKWTGRVWLPFQACIHTHTHTCTVMRFVDHWLCFFNE